VSQAGHARADEGRTADTALGVVAIVIWSSNIAISRSLAEKVGSITAASCMMIAGGLLGCAWEGRERGRMRSMLGLPRAYLLSCGSTFVAYMACLFLAIGMARTRQQTLEVGMLNYLWPALTLVFSVPLLKVRVRRVFWLGVLLALAGGTLAPLQPGTWSPAAMLGSLSSHPGPYVFALAAAVSWALYSNFSRRFGDPARGGAVPLFVLASGLVLALMRPLVDESSTWSVRAIAELAFMALLPTLIAYSLWDRAVRRGHVTLIAALSYLIPVLSTLLSSLYLQVTVGWNLWVACAMIVSGAVVCQRAVVRAPRVAGVSGNDSAGL